MPYQRSGIVKIKTPDKVSQGMGTAITTESGEPVHGVRRAVVTIGYNEPIRAEIEVFCGFEGKAIATYFVAHPATGARKRVKHILFDDGTEWDCEPVEDQSQLRVTE